jgi:hypothetical protein
LTNEDRPLTPTTESSKQTDSTDAKKPWEPMKLTYTGEAKDVVQFPGGGKLSTAPADPGDPKKPQGQG